MDLGCKGKERHEQRHCTAGTVLDKVPILAHLHPTASQRVGVVNPALQMGEQKLGQ